jgi:hypothetical protein
MTTTTAKILNDAADLIDLHGWTQRQFRSTDGCYCASGALEAATPLMYGHYVAACTFMIAEIKETSIAAWNDTAGRTKDQVTTALRNAAVNATFLP